MITWREYQPFVWRGYRRHLQTREWVVRVVLDLDTAIGQLQFLTKSIYDVLKFNSALVHVVSTVNGYLTSPICPTLLWCGANPVSYCIRQRAIKSNNRSTVINLCLAILHLHFKLPALSLFANYDYFYTLVFCQMARYINFDWPHYNSVIFCTGSQFPLHRVQSLLVSLQVALWGGAWVPARLLHRDALICFGVATAMDR